MEKRTFFALGFVVFIVAPCFAHMCHDPFRPKDHLVLTPDKEIIRIEETGEFRMYIENTFRSTLNDLRLFVESQAFNIEVRPHVIERLMPGERSFFLVRLKLRKGFEPGNYPLRINVGARSAELKASIERLDIVVKKDTSLIEAPEPPREEIETPQSVGEMEVKVEKIPFWQKPYFYIILILFLVAILVWRKTK